MIFKKKYKIVLDVRKKVRYNFCIGGICMTNTNITNFRKDIYEMLENTIKHNEPIHISTKNGNAVVLSEEDYNNLIETLYISSIPGLKEDIKQGLQEPVENCINEDEVEW